MNTKESLRIDDNNQNQAYYYTNLGNFDFLKEELFKNFSEGVQRGEIDIVEMLLKVSTLFINVQKPDGNTALMLGN